MRLMNRDTVGHGYAVRWPTSIPSYRSTLPLFHGATFGQKLLQQLFLFRTLVNQFFGMPLNGQQIKITVGRLNSLDQAIFGPGGHFQSMPEASDCLVVQAVDLKAALKNLGKARFGIRQCDTVR